jgi:hypothetical protein
MSNPAVIRDAIASLQEAQEALEAIDAPLTVINSVRKAITDTRLAYRASYQRAFREECVHGMRGPR